MRCRHSPHHLRGTPVLRASFVARIRLPIAATSVAGVLFLTGCQAADPGVGSVPSPTTAQAETPPPTAAVSTAPAVPEPTPASSDGPAANLPVPVKPPLADENTKEGLEAFTRYWFELFNYGYATNDWTAFDAETDPGCRTCASIRSAVGEVYSDGRWIGGAEFSVVGFTSPFEMNTSGSISSFVETEQGAVTYFDADGSELSTDIASEGTVEVVIALFDEGSWLMLDYGQPEGT
ncbi:DUF6318 family protein [Arthrobacter sp. H41]|uniref:DUF6318 family protein n=1 Tax=Arthrobacter sp. H41 TaxID=1312978 RepID=UPI0023B84B6D|nr:DUF6318 family protein [Arthrobacter sp. H41]